MPVCDVANQTAEHWRRNHTGNWAAWYSRGPQNWPSGCISSFFATLQDDYFMLFLCYFFPITPIRLPHSMFHGANKSHQPGIHSSPYHQIYQPFHTFPLLKTENTSSRLFKFRPWFCGSCLRPSPDPHSGVTPTSLSLPYRQRCTSSGLRLSA